MEKLTEQETISIIDLMESREFLVVMDHKTDKYAIIVGYKYSGSVVELIIGRDSKMIIQAIVSINANPAVLTTYLKLINWLKTH